MEASNCQCPHSLCKDKRGESREQKGERREQRAGSGEQRAMSRQYVKEIIKQKLDMDNQIANITTSGTSESS
jgi:hypothetical protein